jgi:hypothetical protein
MLNFLLLLILSANVYHAIFPKLHSARLWWNENIQDYLCIQEFGYKVDKNVVNESYRIDGNNNTYNIPYDVDFDIHRIIFLFM